LLDRKANKISTWKFGSVTMTLTNLEQIDTFRIMQKSQSCPDRGVVFNVAESFGFGNFFDDSRQGKRVAFEHVHWNPKWQSALEVVVNHEVGAFLMSEEGTTGDSSEGLPIFEELIREKWKSFGRSYHLYWVLIPQIVCLSAYMMLLVVRITAVYESRIESEF